MFTGIIESLGTVESVQNVGGDVRLRIGTDLDMSDVHLGDSIATNLLMVGYALQKGLVPLSPEAIEKAIELNEVGIEENRKAFRLGRQAALDLPKFLQATQPPQDEKKKRPVSTSLVK